MSIPALSGIRCANRLLARAEPCVGYRPHDIAALHLGALGVELLHRAGQRAVGGQELYPVADFEQNLCILGAD